MANEKRLIDVTPDGCIKKVKRKTNFAKIIVSGTAEKPYYDIMWFDYMDGQYHIGYGSYNLDFVFQWLSECFEIEDAPTADAVEVVHGRWLPVKYNEYSSGGQHRTVWHLKCSSCNHIAYKQPYGLNYCPNCGAKMDGERREGE